MTFSPIVHLRSGVPFTVRVPGAENGTLGTICMRVPGTSSATPESGPAFYDFDARLVKSFYINRDRGMKVELIVEGTNLLNHTNFSSVNDQFPAGDPFLLTGPFNVTREQESLAAHAARIHLRVPRTPDSTRL